MANQEVILKEIKQTIKDTKSDLKDSISEIKSDLKEDISEIKSDIKDIKNDNKKFVPYTVFFWTIGVIVLGFVGKSFII